MSSKTQKNDTEERILQASWKLLEAMQDKAPRMIDIAREAGISRQAIYLHFKNCSDLLVATTRYVDKVKKVDERLTHSRTAKSGLERLNAFIEAWGNYIPEIYQIGKALMALKDTDAVAAHAWNDRMQAVRHGCEAAVNALKSDGELTSDYSTEQAIDILWTLLSVRNWEHFTQDCGWSQQKYIELTQSTAKRILMS